MRSAVQTSPRTAPFKLGIEKHFGWHMGAFIAANIAFSVAVGHVHPQDDSLFQTFAFWVNAHMPTPQMLATASNQFWGAAYFLFSWGLGACWWLLRVYQYNSIAPHSINAPGVFVGLRNGLGLTFFAALFITVYASVLDDRSVFAGRSASIPNMIKNDPLGIAVWSALVIPCTCIFIAGAIVNFKHSISKALKN